MLWLVALLLIVIAVLILWLVIQHFSTRSAIEDATLEYRLAVEYAAQMGLLRDAGGFICAWAKARDRIDDLYPEFAAYRIRRVYEELQEAQA